MKGRAFDPAAPAPRSHTRLVGRCCRTGPGGGGGWSRCPLSDMPGAHRTPCRLSAAPGTQALGSKPWVRAQWGADERREGRARGEGKREGKRKVGARDRSKWGKYFKNKGGAFPQLMRASERALKHPVQLWLQEHPGRASPQRHAAWDRGGGGAATVAQGCPLGRKMWNLRCWLHT